MTRDPHSRLDDAFEKIAKLATVTAVNAAQLDGVEQRLEHLDEAQQETKKEMGTRFDQMGNEMRDRFADVRSDLQSVSVKTAIISGALVTLVCSVAGGLAMWGIQHTVKAELQQRTQTQTTPQTGTQAAYTIRLKP